MRKPKNEFKRLGVQIGLFVLAFLWIYFNSPRDFSVFVNKLMYIASFFLLAHIFRVWQFPYIKYGDILHEAWESAKGNPLPMAIIFLAVSVLIAAIYLTIVVGGSLGT